MKRSEKWERRKDFLVEAGVFLLKAGVILLLVYMGIRLFLIGDGGGLDTDRRLGP
jgi:hypothetical protein